MSRSIAHAKDLTVDLAAPAIANAVHHAIGVRLTETPMTGARVLAALHGMPAPIVR